MKRYWISGMLMAWPRQVTGEQKYWGSSLPLYKSVLKHLPHTRTLNLSTKEQIRPKVAKFLLARYGLVSMCPSLFKVVNTWLGPNCVTIRLKEFCSTALYRSIKLKYFPFLPSDCWHISHCGIVMTGHGFINNSCVNIVQSFLSYSLPLLTITSSCSEL